MILSCNSCEKKFVVPDNAISASGRLVQCSSCGNKWKQFPVISEIEKKNETTKIKSIEKIAKPIKQQRKTKKAGPSLYSPEYLAKKHGIKIKEKITIKENNLKKQTNLNFGFYNSLIIFFVFIVFILRILYFFQNLIIERFPFLKNYIDYLFESINNVKEIILSFFLGY